jgi:5-amino-6-(5-phosphoribosylamino)uracil reductase
VQPLWPTPTTGPLSDDELASAYAYPEQLDRPFVRVNFVSSLDGAVTADGRSSGLSGPADRRVFHLLRRLCEVVLVGAGTARSERYGGATRPSLATGRPPRIAVLTRGAALDPGSRLFTEATLPPLVLTPWCAPEPRRRALSDAGAEVVELPSDPVAPRDVLTVLAQRGLRRVLCEGGPRLFADLIEADAVDELCLTISPVLAAGGAGRIAAGSGKGYLREMRIAGVLAEDDMLFTRYRRKR